MSSREAPAPPQAWPVRLLGTVAALCLFGMMALTFCGVVARYFLNMPIPGDSELQAFLLGFIIFTALPLVTRRERHIAVRSFASLLKGRALFLQRVFVLAATALGFAFMGYLILLQAQELQEEGTLSTYLDIPEAPFTYGFAALTAIAALVAGERLVALLRGKNEAANAADAETAGPE